MKTFLFLLFLINYTIFSDEKLGGQEIIEKLDRSLTLNDGLTTATLSMKKGNHETHFWKVNIFKKQDDVLYTFEVTNRKPVAKFLSIKRGNKLIYYNVFSGKIFQIEQMEKMENLLHTSFNYLDFSYYQYETNYKAEEVNNPKSESSDPIIVKIVPISTPSYKHLELYVDKTNYSPLKIDFTSPDGFLIKTLKLKYGQIKVRDGKSVSEQPSITRLEMNDNSTNYTSILEFKEWNKTVNPDKILYEMKTLYEK